MAKVVWAPGISSVSGALTKINKKSQHAADQKMLLATHRKAETTSTNCQNLYLRGLDSITRKTPVQSNEIEIRNRFKTVSRAVATRMKNFSTIASDRAAYNAQKDQPNGKKTFKSYIWALELEAYDNQ